MLKISINDNPALTTLVQKTVQSFAANANEAPDLTLEECLLLGEFNNIMDLVKTILLRGAKLSHSVQSSLLFLLHQGLFEYQNKVEDDGNLNRDFTLCQCIEAQIRSVVETANDELFALIREIIASLFDVGMTVSDDFLTLVNEIEYDIEDEDEPEVDLRELVEHMEVLAKEIHAESCYDVYLQVAEQLNQMPPDAGLLIITGLLHAADPLVRDSAILFLLHPQPKVRDSLLLGLVALAQQNLLDHHDFQRLMTLRRWVDDDARAIIDQTIKQLQRNQVSLLASDKSAALPLEAIWVTPIDNSGSMILQVVFKVGRKLRMIGCILKQIYGIKDAYSSALMNRSEYKKILAKSSDAMPMVEISTAQLTLLLNHFVAENRASDRQVPVEILMLTEFMANDAVLPQKLTLDLVEQANRSVAVKTPAQLELDEFLYGWGSPELSDNHRTAKAVIEAEFEPHRQLWLERLLLSLLCFDAVLDDKTTFRQSIQQILAEKPLSSIGFFKKVAKIILEEAAEAQASDLSRHSEAMIEQLIAEDPRLLASLASLNFNQEFDDFPDFPDLPAIPAFSKLLQWPVGERPKRAVYQLKINLQGCKPAVWRRVLVMNTISLNKLHLIIQIAMGWEDCHVYEFSASKQRFCAEDEFATGDAFDDRSVQIRDLLSSEKDKLNYLYDMGDNWQHKIVLEKIIPAQKRNTPVQVIAGSGACPPEDVGGVPGYQHMFEVLQNPQHEDYAEFCDWLGIENGEQFDAKFVDLYAANEYLNEFVN